MKFEIHSIFETEEFQDNCVEDLSAAYDGDDFRSFTEIYKNKKYMGIHVKTSCPKIPEDIHYLMLLYLGNYTKFPKIPASVKVMRIGTGQMTELPEIPDTVIELSIYIDREDGKLKNTGDLSYLKNLKKLVVEHRYRHLAIGKLPESLRLFSSIGINGTITLPEKFPKNLFFIHLHGLLNVDIPDLSSLKKLKILSSCHSFIKSFSNPPINSCEIRFISMRPGSKALPINYRKNREKITYTTSTPKPKVFGTPVL